MNSKLVYVTLLAAALVAVALFGCQAQPAASPTKAPAAPATAPAPAPTSAPAAAATQAPAAAATQAPAAAAAVPATAETIKVGIMMPMTGVTARTGRISERFVRLGIDDVNAKGGVKVGGKSYRLDGVTADEKYTSEGGREAANRLVLAEKVKFILGGTANGTAGSQPITEPSKVLQIATGATDAMLGPQHPLTIAAGFAHQRMRALPLYDWMVKNNPQAKNIALVLPDDPNGRAFVTIAEAAAADRGLNIAAREFFPQDIKDMGPLVTRVLRANPDAIDIGMTGTAVAPFLSLGKALNEQGYRKPWFGTIGVLDTLRQGGPSVEGFVFIGLVDYNSPLVPAAEKDVIQRYIKQYGEAELDLISETSYNLASVLAQGMEKAGTVDDTEKIAKTLRDSELDTIWGKMRIIGTKTFGGLPAFMESIVYLSKVEGGKPSTFAAAKATMP